MQNDQSTQDLQSIRSYLVSERRDLARKIVSSEVIDKGSFYERQPDDIIKIDKIIAVQAKIEAIDRAIADEKREDEIIRNARLMREPGQAIQSEYDPYQSSD